MWAKLLQEVFGDSKCCMHSSEVCILCFQNQGCSAAAWCNPGERSQKHPEFCFVWPVLSTFTWVPVNKLRCPGYNSTASTFIHWATSSALNVWWWINYWSLHAQKPFITVNGLYFVCFTMLHSHRITTHGLRCCALAAGIPDNVWWREPEDWVRKKGVHIYRNFPTCHWSQGALYLISPSLPACLPPTFTGTHSSHGLEMSQPAPISQDNSEGQPCSAANPSSDCPWNKGKEHRQHMAQRMWYREMGLQPECAWWEPIRACLKPCKVGENSLAQMYRILPGATLSGGPRALWETEADPSRSENSSCGHNRPDWKQQAWRGGLASSHCQY